MRAVVAGCGYLGASLVARLLHGGHDVAVLDDLSSTDAAVVRGFGTYSGCRFVHGSLLDAVAVDAALGAVGKPDVVFLFAGQSSANPTAASVEQTELTNLRGPRVVLDRVVASGVSTVVYASSMRYYGPTLPGDVDEICPPGEFGDLVHLSQLYGEKLMELYANRHGLCCRALRFGLILGVGPVMKTDQRFMTAPNKFCWQASRGEQLTVTSHRGFHALVHVADAARAALAVTEAATGAGFVAVNVATSVRTIPEVARAVESAAAKLGIRGSLPGLPGDAPDTARPLVRSRLTGLGFQAIYDLDRAVDDTLTYFVGLKP